MSSSHSSDSSRKPPKKRKVTSSVLDNCDDEDDDDDLLNSSPVFRSTKMPATQTRQQGVEPPRRKSPRRSNTSTLDGATSSPSMTISSIASPCATPSQAKAAAAPSPSHDEIVIIDDDPPSPSHSEKNKQENSLSKSSNDTVQKEQEQTSPFTLVKVAKASEPRQQSSTLNAETSKKTKKTEESAKNKKRSKSAKNDPPPTDSLAHQTTTSTAEEGTASAAARVSMSTGKKPRENSKNLTTSDDATNEDLPLAKEKKTKKKNAKKTNAAKASAVTSKENAGSASPRPSQKHDEKAATTDVTNEKRGKTTVREDKAQQTPLVTGRTNTMPTSASTTASSTPQLGDDKPKKKKTKKLNFQDSVFQHMFLAMKPFNMKDLTTQLNTTEEQLKSVMLSLIDKGLIAKKEFQSNKNRTKTLYWAVDGVVAKEVAVTQPASLTERNSAKQRCQSLQTELASLQKTMADVKSDLSNEGIDQRLEEEERAWKDLQQKVDDVRARMTATKPARGLARKGPPKPPATPNNLKRRINHMRDEWKIRKTKCTDFCDQLSDAMEKKPKEVFKLLDLETDEMCGVALPPKYEVEPDAKKKRY